MYCGQSALTNSDSMSVLFKDQFRQNHGSFNE